MSAAAVPAMIFFTISSRGRVARPERPGTGVCLLQVFLTLQPLDLAVRVPVLGHAPARVAFGAVAEDLHPVHLGVPAATGVSAHVWHQISLWALRLGWVAMAWAT